MSPVDLASVVPVAHDPETCSSCSSASRSERPEQVAIAIAEDPIPEVATKLVTKRTKFSLAVVSIAVAIARFRVAFEQSSVSALAKLMSVRMDWQLILVQTYPYFYSKSYTSHDLWEFLEKACEKLSQDGLLDELGFSSAIEENDALLCLTVNYMAYRCLKWNKGVKTSILSVQNALRNGKIVDTWSIGAKLDATIFHSSFVHEESTWATFSIDEGKAILMETFHQISLYHKERCAGILVKMAYLFARAGAMNLILAFADSPFSDALKHIQRITRDADTIDAICIE